MYEMPMCCTASRQACDELERDLITTMPAGDALHEWGSTDMQEDQINITLGDVVAHIINSQFLPIQSDWLQFPGVLMSIQR